MVGESVSTTHEWRKLEAFQKGDTIHRWGDDLPVESVELLPDGHVRLMYRDTDDNAVKMIDDRKSAKYITRKRDVPLDAVDEEAQKAVFERMLPPVIVKTEDTPEQVAKRVIRHVEEWME